MINKEEEQHRLQQVKTDELLPRAWKSGSLKYDELKPLSEGGTAKLYLTEDLNLHRVAYKSLHQDLQILTLRLSALLGKPGLLQTFSTPAQYQSTNWVEIGQVGYFSQ